MNWVRRSPEPSNGGVAAIIGGALGATLGAMLLVMAGMALAHRRRRKQSADVGRSRHDQYSRRAVSPVAKEVSRGHHPSPDLLGGYMVPTSELRENPLYERPVSGAKQPFQGLLTAGTDNTTYASLDGTHQLYGRCDVGTTAELNNNNDSNNRRQVELPGLYLTTDS